jgi:hypothetical protein
VPRVVLVVLLVLVSGCGGGSENEPAASTATPQAAATATAAAAGGSHALRRQSYNGFSMLVPADWKQEKDTDGVIYGAPDDKGALGLYVMDSPYTAKEYVDTIILSSKKTRVLERRKVAVEGVGTGIAVRTTQSKDDDTGWWQLTAATIDGQLVSVMITSSPHVTDEQAEQMLRSVERDA